MRLGHRQPDGCTRREHLQAGAAASGRVPEELLATAPDAGTSLWEAFLDLTSGRPPSMGGGSLIPPSEFVAWQSLHGVRLTSWEVETLQAMDRAAVAQTTELHNKSKAQR